MFNQNILNEEILNYTSYWTSPSNNFPNTLPSEIVSDKKGNIYFAEHGGNRIAKFSPDTKTMTEYITENENLFSSVYFEDCDMEFFVLTEEYDNLTGYRCVDFDWVTLLAYEDPSLKGYYESRFRYVDKAFYSLLFNQIGEVRAGILHNGKAIGVWTWDKRQKKIQIEYFSEVDKCVQRKVNAIKDKYEFMLNPTQQLSIF